MAKASFLGLAEPPGPYTSPSSLYNPNRFAVRDSFTTPRSGTRAGFENLGQRSTVYVNTPGVVPSNNYTSMAEQVEKTMGNCRPGLQDQANAYGPPSAPNMYTSYPVLARFENRKKWNDAFSSPFEMASKDNPQAVAPKGGPVNGNGRSGNNSGGGGNNGNSAGNIDYSLKIQNGPLPVPTKQPPILLGCNLMSNGEDQLAHRMTYLNRFFDEDDGEIMIQQPKTMQDKYVGSYSDQLFKTAIDNTDNKVSTGVMVNPYTGEMYETFENAMPPPNTDKWIPSERFEIVNPKLLQMFGGLDPHAPLPKKKEICLKVPTADFGPNVWGDQLFEEDRRSRMLEIVNRDLWMNRDGDYAGSMAFAKEKPAGYVGVQQMYRALPYLPPVNVLDNKGYMPVSASQVPESAMIKAEVAVRKPDLTTCPFQVAAGPINDQEAEYVVGQYTNRPTWRGGNDTYYAGTPYLPNQGATAPQQTQNKPTLKEFSEQAPTITNAQTVVSETGGNSFVVSSTSNKPTLKEFMEQKFSAGPQQNQTLASGGAGFVVVQTQNKPTLKEFSEQRPDVTNTSNAVNQSGGAMYTVSQYANKPTLKEFMENTPDVLNAMSHNLATGGSLYTIQQYQNRPTLKEQMEQRPDIGSQQNQTLVSGGAGHTVLQTQNKSTLKEFMENSFAANSQQNQTLASGGAGHTVLQTQNRPTLKEFAEEEFPVSAFEPNQADQGHVVLQVENRPTLKQLMQQPFDFTNFQDGGNNVTGAYIDFQGPLLEVARAYYEYLPNVGRPASFSDGVGGDYVGNGLITSKQNRGVDSTDWVSLDKVPQDAMDTSVTWIGVYDRDTKRELGPNTPVGDFASSYQSVSGRAIGALTPQCNLDLREINDEWLWSSGFAPQMPQVITG